MLSKNLFKEVIKMLIGVFILSFIMVIVFFILNGFDIRVIWGALLGSTVCVLNYFFLALSIENAVSKGDKAKGSMGISYMLRMVFIGISILVAIKLPCFNYVAAVIPFLFPRIVLLISAKKGGDKN